MKEIIHKEFKIFLGEGVLDFLSEILIENEYSKVFVLMDNNTYKYCWPVLSPSLVNYVTIVIPEGEQHKTLAQAEKIWAALQQNHADRKTVLINLGGGVISDLGGFCAAAFKRGIDFINIPTSLLGMVDASIGGKLGVDFHAYKNVIGFFQHPKYILIHPSFLRTLPVEEIRNGMAELSKHALISDKELFNKLAAYNEIGLDKLPALIFQSIKIKAQIVKKDPFEKDIRKTLNFGHTIGHAIESASILHDKVPLKHGEAIAIGMICEAYISKAIEKLSSPELEMISKFYRHRFSKYQKKLNYEELLGFMRNDKKNKDGLINFTLLKRIGKPKIDVNCHDKLIIESLEYYQNLA